MASATGSNPTSCAKAASTTGTTAASRSSRNIRASSLRSDTIRPLAEVIENPATTSSRHANQQLKSVRANQGTATKWLDVTHMHDFYPLAASGKKAKCVVNMFVCEPRRLEHQQAETTTTKKKLVFPVRILERHPFTPQTFIPMGVSAGDRNVRYLVIVAPTLPSSSYPSAVSQRKRSLKERLFGRGSAFRTDAYASSATLTQTSEEYHGPPRKGPGPPDLDNLQAFIARGDQAVTYGAGTWHAPMVVLGDRPIEFVVVQYSNGVANEDCQEVEITTADDGLGLAVEIDDTDSVKAKL